MRAVTRLVFACGLLLPFFGAHILRSTWPPIWQTFIVAFLGFGGARAVEWIVHGRPGTNEDISVGRQLGGYALGVAMILASIRFAMNVVDPNATPELVRTREYVPSEVPLSGPATIPVTLPAPVVGDWRSVAVGWMHACGLRRDKSVWCWGDDRYLGSNADRDSSEPVRVLDVEEAESVAATSTSSCALWGGAHVSCWGDDLSGTMPIKTLKSPSVTTLQDITQVSVGSGHACALDKSSVVRCWGQNADGQLGLGTRTASEQPSVVAGLAPAKNVAAGDRVSCALTNDGNTLCWGAIHLDTTSPDHQTVATPTAISGVERGQSLSMGRMTACVVAESGNIWCWGYVPGHGRIADTPVRVNGISGASAVAIGTSHGCAIVAGGRVQCFGSNELGGLANPDRRSTGPLFVESIVNAVSIAAGDFGTCAATQDGTLTCWGLRKN